MKQNLLHFVVALGCALLAFPLFAADSVSTLRLDPHLYSGPRGNEPSRQFVVQAKQKWNGQPTLETWDISIHAEAETMGRRDISLDLDRAWYRFPLGDKDGLTLGRIHPWDVSGRPEADRPWGYLAQTQSQNRGVLLGYGYGPDPALPSPILLGWIGAHYWSDTALKAPFAWGFSISPIFLPSMGSELSLSPKDPASAGRFARRPPGYVELDGAMVPIHYELDQSDLLRDVVLQPQAMAQAHWDLSGLTDGLQGWLSLSRSPTPDPSYGAKERLNVTPTTVEGTATIRPRFPQRLSADLTHTWLLSSRGPHPKLMVSLHAADDKRWGYEVGADSDYFGISFLDDKSFAAIDAPYVTSEARYTDQLLQAEARLPIHPLVIYSGVLTHITQKDIWIRSGIRLPIERRGSLDLGGDVFGGNDGTYFGEWRTNDRISMVFQWQLGI